MQDVESGGLPQVPAADGQGVRVVVVGGGMAGLAAALQARADGADVTLLDKRGAADFGGNTRISGGAFLAPSGATARAREDFVESLVNSTAGRGNAALFRVIAANALADLEWLRSLGASFLPAYACAPPHRCSVHPLAPGQFVGMPALMLALQKAMEQAGVRTRWDSAVEDLIRDDAGVVRGVVFRHRGHQEEFPADAVVLAGGGYSGDRALLRERIGPEMDAVALRGVDWLFGECIGMAQRVGASVRNMDGLDSVHVAAVHPDLPGGGNPSRAIPYSIAINERGLRYVDESKGYVANGKAALRQPGQTVAIVFDEALKQAPGVRTSLQTYANMGLPVVSAPTLAGLAQAIGVPAAALNGTVAAFNAAVVDGAAPLADPPKAAWAAPIETPPFHAFHPCRPAITLTFGGVEIDEQARVLTADGGVMPGLYAAGEMAGCLFHHDYLGGGSLSNCLVMGRIAGRHAARRGPPVTPARTLEGAQ